MIQVTFIEDYFSQGRVQIPKGHVEEMYENDTIKLPDGFLNIYDIYDLEKRKVVTITQLD